MATPYIPATDAGFDAWTDNFASILTANPLSLGETAAEALVVQTAYDTWAAAFGLVLNPITRTPATVANKDAARVTLDAAVRPVAMRINARDSVTNLQRSSLGITIRKTTRTPVPPPVTAPTIALRSMIPGVATVSVRDETTPTSKAKPFGVIGSEIFVQIGSVPGTDPADADIRKTITKTPNTVSFSPSEIGQMATLWARWATRSGPGGVAQVGPWSVPLSFVVA